MVLVVNELKNLFKEGGGNIELGYICKSCSGGREISVAEPHGVSSSNRSNYLSGFLNYRPGTPNEEIDHGLLVTSIIRNSYDSAASGRVRQPCLWVGRHVQGVACAAAATGCKQPPADAIPGFNSA